MRVARKHHLCEKYIMNSMEVILAAGGTSASEEMLDTVEIFFIVNEVWSTMVQVILFEIGCAIFFIQIYMNCFVSS